MIKFLKPNKSKLKLAIFIFLLFFTIYALEALMHPFLKNYSSKDYEELMRTEKYQDLHQSIEKMNKNMKNKIIEGNELSSLHVKYVVINAITLFSIALLLSYLGACFIYRHWKIGVHSNSLKADAQSPRAS